MVNQHNPHKYLKNDLIKKNYLESIQESLALDFSVCLLDIKSIDIQIKKHFIELQKIKKITDEAQKIIKIEEFYLKISSSKNLLSSIIDLEAKFQDVLRRARKSAVNDLICEYKSHDNDERYSLLAVLNRCFDNNISAKAIQVFINNYFRAPLSLTAHPTNPMSLEYTIIGNQFDAFLTDKKNLNFKKLHEIIKKLILCPITSHKKSCTDEMIEAELAIKNNKKAHKELLQKWQSQIEKSPYFSQIKIPKKILELAVWTHGGDADGNPNITSEVLSKGLERIKKYRLGVKIDIRHDAKDIEECLIETLKNFNSQNFSFDSEEQKINEIERIINDQKKCKEIGDWLASNSFLNHEIIKRLRIANQDWRMIDKFIISNHSSASQVLSVLLMFKLTHSQLKIMPINIVTLSESLEDLQNIFNIYQRLIDSKIFQKHISKTKKIIAMIAKSDSVRVAGVAVDFYQDWAVGKILTLKKIIQQKYKISCAVHIFSGHGNALARGGGRFDEIPLRHALCALNESQESQTDLNSIDASLITVQGQQQQILFSSIKNSKNAIENFALSNLLSALICANHLNLDQNYDLKNNSVRRDFSDTAIEFYQHKYYQNQFINELFFNANHLGVALANLSSRPLKRGQKQQNILAPIKYSAFRGELKNYNLFNTRAITLDRTLAHTASFALMFFGVREAFENFMRKNQNLELPKQLYFGNKTFFDFIRNQLITLHLVDIKYTWRMLLGSDRPSIKEILSLADKYQNLANDKSLNLAQRQKITLAFIDKYIFDVAIILAKMLFGDDNLLDFKKYNLTSLLEKHNPELASEMNYRKKSAIFTRELEAQFVSKLNKNPDIILDDDDLKNIHSLYIANNPTFNTPIYLNAPMALK